MSRLSVQFLQNPAMSHLANNISIRYRACIQRERNIGRDIDFRRRDVVVAALNKSTNYSLHSDRPCYFRTGLLPVHFPNQSPGLRRKIRSSRRRIFTKHLSCTARPRAEFSIFPREVTERLNVSMKSINVETTIAA